MKKQRNVTWNSLAIDIASRLKATEKAKDLAIVCLSIVIVIITVWFTMPKRKKGEKNDSCM